MKARLLHVHNECQAAGCERSCATLVRAGKDYRHTVAVLGGEGPAIQDWQKEGADIVVLRAGFTRFEQYRKLRRLVQELRPSGVILWTNVRTGLLVSACQQAGVERVAVHVGNPVEFGAGNRLAARFYQTLPKAKAAVLVAVSRHVARSIEQEKAYSCYPFKVVHNAIDLTAFAFRVPAATDGPIRIGMVARLDPIKDHATLIRAWPHVLRNYPNAVLELAGDGALRNGLNALAREVGCASQIRFLDWVENIPGVMRSWQLMVHATTELEGLGNSMLEAMTMGLPLVATDIGPVREVTDDGRAAILVRPRDPERFAAAIGFALRSPKETAERVRHARGYMEREFSTEAMLSGYVECLGL